MNPVHGDKFLGVLPADLFPSLAAPADFDAARSGSSSPRPGYSVPHCDTDTLCGNRLKPCA